MTPELANLYSSLAAFSYLIPVIALIVLTYGIYRAFK